MAFFPTCQSGAESRSEPRRRISLCGGPKLLNGATPDKHLLVVLRSQTGDYLLGPRLISSISLCLSFTSATCSPMIESHCLKRGAQKQRRRRLVREVRKRQLA